MTFSFTYRLKCIAVCLEQSPTFQHILMMHAHKLQNSIFYSVVPQCHLMISKPPNFVSKFVVNWTLNGMSFH